MKKKKTLLTEIAVLAPVLAGCFSPCAGDTGGISIGFGGSSKTPVNPAAGLSRLRRF